MTHARRRWAYRMMSRCSAPPPVYGSAEWLALPEGSAEKVAAVVCAAECWATDGDNIEANLRAEFTTATAANKRADDEEYVARRDAHRDRWRGLRVVRGAYADSEDFLSGGRTA